MNIVQGLMVNVLRPTVLGDCTNGGITSRYNRMILIGEGIEGPENVDLDNPKENVLAIVKRYLFGKDYYHAEPLDGCNVMGQKWYSFGGNSIDSSDSRYGSKFDYPLHIHDRREY